LKELRQCPGAVDLQAGDVITTGTWTDAWPLQAGESWRAEFSDPLGSLSAEMR
jgi:2-oxo-3-hexenedioate decarboxylase